MELKFYAKNKQERLLWIKTAVLFIFSGILAIGNTSAQTPGTALDFESSTMNKVVVPSAPALNITNAITIEAWIYVKNTGGLATQDVICKSSGSVNNSYIFPRTDDRWNNMKFMLKLNGQSDWTTLSTNFKTGPNPISTNAWHHVAATYDGGTMRIYVDGALRTSMAATGTITVNNNPLVIGGQTDYTNEYFQGKVDEVRIWSRALSQCEISNNKNCELTGAESGLNAYYKCNGGLADLSNLLFTTLPDATANHNDGTLTNFLLTGVTSNWTTNPNVGGNCTPFIPINATAGASATVLAVGDNLQLTASGGTSYSWTGPNGFTSTQQNPAINNAQLVNSGTYTVVVTQNGCSATAAVTVTVALRAKALLFDGNNDMIRVPNSSSLNSNTFTVEGWIKPQSNTPLVQNVISKMKLNPDQGFIFPRTDDGWLNFSLWMSVNGQGVTISAPFGNSYMNNWSHVAATYDGFNVKLYLNGSLVATQAIQGFTMSNGDITMGVQEGYSQYYKGGLDEVRIWKRALTQCELQNNMTCELNGANNGITNYTGLGAYFRFNQGLINVANTGVTALADSSGNGNNGTLSNFDLSGTASNWAAGGSVNNATCSVFQALNVSASSNGPVVEVGQTAQLFASGGTNWSWSGPGGFTSNQQNPTIPNATVTNTGVYTVTVQGTGCTVVASTKLTVAYRSYSLNFDGNDDEVKVPASASLNNIKTGITMEAWIYPTSSAKAIQDVMGKSTRDVNNGYIFPRTDNGWGSYVFYLHVNGEWQKLDAPYPGLNQWHHVAATYDGYYMRIYLDGALSASKEVYGTITQNLNDLVIGQQPGFEEHFSGSVDEARIWNRALNQCEIMNNLYCELHPLQRDGLVTYYKFNQGFDNIDNSGINILVDSSANGNNGALQNFALQGPGSNWVANYSSTRTNSTCAYNELPHVTAFANGSLFSPGSTIKLFATGGFEYHWNGPQGFTSNYVNPTIYGAQSNMSGTYTVTAPFVHCEVTASTRIVVNDQPSITANGPLTFCPSGSVTLSSTNTGTAYQWFKNDVLIPGATGSTYTVTQSGTYTLNVTSPVDVLVSEPIVVTVEDNAAPVPANLTLPTIFARTPAEITTIPTASDNCAGTITATTTDPLTYLYEGNYTITWTYDDHNGHVVQQTQNVVVTLGVDYKPPVLTVPANISLTGDVSICGAVANFAATATDNSPDPVTITYSQNPGTVFPVGTTTVLVTATDATGNAMTGTFTVTVSPTIVAPITGNTTICAGANTTLATASTGGTWSSANNAIATVDPNSGVVTGVAAGTVVITYTNACGAKATATVTVNATPAKPIIRVDDNCGSSVLTVTNVAGNLLWSNNATSASITVNAAGTYTVTQSNANGCTSPAGAADASPKTIPDAPSVTVINNCGNSDLTVNGAIGTLRWSNNANTSTINVITAGTYTVTQTTANGCTSLPAPATAAPKAVPTTPGIVVANNCGSSTLTATGVTGSVIWSNDATTTSIVVDRPGVYSVKQLVGDCYSAPASANANPGTQPAQPVVVVVDNCGSSTLSVNNAAGTLLWSNNATGSSITVTTPGTYSVRQTVTGCVSEAGEGTAAPKAIPLAPTGSSASRCGAGNVTLSASAGAGETIDWYASASGGTALVSGSPDFVATLVAGNKTYYAETRNTTTGCVSAARTAVTATFIAVPATPNVVVSNGCGSTTLSASGTNLQWSNGATGSPITVTAAGTYYVTQTVNGCASAAGSGTAAPVAIPAVPVISVVNNCGSSVLSTDATGTLVWSNGATGASITVNTNNTYTVKTTVNTCSSVSDPVSVTIRTVPVVAPIVGAATVVSGASTQFSNTTADGVWSSDNNAVATVGTTGLVTGVSIGNTQINYTVTSAAGCSTKVSAPIGVTANCTAPVITASNITANTLATATGCNSPVSYSLSTSGTTPVTFSYVLTGATTGSGSGTGSGAVFNVGVTNVKVTATNACGTNTANFTVTLKDGTAPVPVVSSLPTITGQCSVNLGATTSNNSSGCQDDCSCCRNSCHCRTSSCNCRGYDYRNIISYILSYLYNYYYGDDNHGCDHDDDDNSATSSNAPKATDNCKGTIVGTTTDPLSYNSQGTYTIHWRYDDGNGNVTVQEQTVIVKDDTKPTINVPGNITLSCGASTTPSACGGSATGSDNCSGVTISYTDAPNAAGTQILRTWKATDAAGNYSTGVQTITITDNTKPVISDVADITLSCVGSTDPSVTGRPTATDCSAVTITYSDATNGKYITRTWKATDAFGNYSTSTQKITISDNTKPVISDVADVTVNCNGSTDPSATGRPTASDCSGVTLTYSDATSGNVITRTWKATDGAGNYSTSTQKITTGTGFAVDITSVPTSSVYTGGIATNLYLGYGAQSTTLQTCALPSAGAPYTYAWNGTATNRLNSTSSAAPVFSPNSAGSATFYVTVTNRYGCTSTDVITICVTDIRVPNSGGSKVFVCHQTNSKTNPTQTIEVSVNAVPAHIGNGSSNGCGNKDNVDRLGSCDQAPCGTTTLTGTVSTIFQGQTATAESGVPSGNQKTTSAVEAINVIVLPNPSTTYFTLKFESRNNAPMNLRVMDGNGRIVDARSAIVPNTSLQIGHNYSSGTYYAEVIQGGQRKVVQLIKARG